MVIDGTIDAASDVPEEFRAVQWTRLRPAGFVGQALHEPSLERFCARVGKLLGGEVTVAGYLVGARFDRVHDDGRGRVTPLLHGAS